MDNDPQFSQEMRATRFLIALAILWGALCITCGSWAGITLAFFGFIMVGLWYAAGPNSRKR